MPNHVQREETYEAMSRDQLIARLKVAEDALVLVGWTSTNLGSFAGHERADAAEQMWSLWRSMMPEGLTDREANEQIISMVPALAMQRRGIREHTLQRIRELIKHEGEP